MSQNNQLVLPYHLVNRLVDLLDVQLPGPRARARNRVIGLLAPFVKEYEAKRLALIEKYGEKDAEDKLVVLPNNHYKLTDEAAFNTEWNEFRESELKIPVVPGSIMDFHLVKDVILNLETPMDVEATASYDLICQAFEKLS